MNQNPVPKKRARTFGRRSLLVSLLLIAAFVTYVVTRSKTPAPVAMNAPVKVPTWEQLIAALPKIPGATETGKLLAKTIDSVRISPGVSASWVLIGDILAQEYRSSGDSAFHEHAEAIYRHALALDARNAEAMTGLAWVFGGRHMFVDSLEWARRALEIDPNNQAAYGISGDAALEQGDYDLAFDHYQKMTDLRPDLSSWSRGAHLLWVTGSTTKAIALMQMAIRAGAPFAENTAWCRAKLAMMFFNDGALLPAQQTIGAALASAPDNVHVLLAAGRIAIARNDVAAAEAHYKKVLERGPHLEALVALGDLHLSRGEKPKAEEYFEKVEALHMSNVATAVHDHTIMAKFYADHDRRLDEALRLAEQHKLTRNVQEADVLAWVCFKNGDRARAVEFMKLALSRNTPDPELEFHAGMIAAEAGDVVSAEKHLQRAVALNPRFHPLLADVAAKKLEQVIARPTASVKGNLVPSKP